VRGVNEAARDLTRLKMKTKALLKSRDQRKRVEMRFAHLKAHHGFEHMRLRVSPASATISPQYVPHLVANL